jgi:hypothetical protein
MEEGREKVSTSESESLLSFLVETNSAPSVSACGNSDKRVAFIAHHFSSVHRSRPISAKRVDSISDWLKMVVCMGMDGKLGESL